MCVCRVYVWYLVDECFISEPLKFPVFEIAMRSKSIVDVICFMRFLISIRKPRKINMESEHTHLEKENNLPNHHFRFYVNLRGCFSPNQFSNKAVVQQLPEKQRSEAIVAHWFSLHVSNIRGGPRFFRKFVEEDSNKVDPEPIVINPIGSMYGIFTYIWLIFMVNV